MIVTIDGPAAAGKTTVGKELARRLGFKFLNSGGFYRGIALATLRAQIDYNDEEELLQVAAVTRVELSDGRIAIGGEDVTDVLRSSRVAERAGIIASSPRLRSHLLELQRSVAERHDVVAEGRSQGLVVFPNAQLKTYLTASPNMRAKRRWAELVSLGESRSFDDVLNELTCRDEWDRKRLGTASIPRGTIVLNTDAMSVEDVVTNIETLVRTLKD